MNRGGGGGLFIIGCIVLQLVLGMIAGFGTASNDGPETRVSVGDSGF